MTLSMIIYRNNWFIKIIGGLLLASLFLSCSSSSKKEDHELKIQITKQLKSIEGNKNLNYLKTVTDLSNDSPTIEDTVLKASEHDLSTILINDLDYAFQLYQKNPLYEDIYDFSSKNDTLIAHIIPGNAKKYELQEQKILWNDDKTNIRYLVTRINKTNWLYKLDVTIAVHFDSTGAYQNHNMYLANKVQMIGGGIEAKIKGKLEEK